MFGFAGLQIKMSQTLPPEDRMSSAERVCRRQARDAEWKFRVSKGKESNPLGSGANSNMPHKE